MIENPETGVTQEERTMATLAHSLQVVGWWIAPLVIFLIHRKSRFVSFHALQALILQIVYLILMIGFMVVWMGTVFGMLAHQNSGIDAAPPPYFFIVIPLVWLGFMGVWACVLIVAIVYAIKAGRGQWANYPLIGNMARRFLKITDVGEIAPSLPLGTP